MVAHFHSFHQGLLKQIQVSFIETCFLFIFCLFVIFHTVVILLNIHRYSSLLCCSWQVVTYLAGCGLQSCPMLLAKGYPDVGWNPIEGERYLSFLRFAVFVNSESHVLHAQDRIIINYGFIKKMASCHCFVSVSVIDYIDDWQLARELRRRSKPDKHLENAVTDPTRTALLGLRLASSLCLFSHHLISFTELMSMHLRDFRLVCEWVRRWMDA